MKSGVSKGKVPTKKSGAPVKGSKAAGSMHGSNTVKPSRGSMPK